MEAKGVGFSCEDRLRELGLFVWRRL